MKKSAVLLMVLFAMLWSANAFAVLDANTNEGATTAGEAIRLTDGLAVPNVVVLNFSPSINAIYLADTADDAGNKQWYAVATYHSGGQSFFASSADSTGVYKQGRESNDVFGDVIVPTSKSMTVGEGDAAETFTAEEYWLENSWEK